MSAGGSQVESVNTDVEWEGVQGAVNPKTETMPAGSAPKLGRVLVMPSALCDLLERAST